MHDACVLTSAVCVHRASRKADQVADVDGVDSGLPSEQKRARQLQGKRKKKRACDKFVASGMCKFGDSCKFSHDTHGAARPANGEEQKRDEIALRESGHGEHETERKAETHVMTNDRSDAAMAVR